MVTHWLRIVIGGVIIAAAITFVLMIRGTLTATLTASTFTLLALVASLASLGYQIWRTGLVQAADLLMRFEQNFFGTEKVRQRSQAATNLLNDPNDFLEMEDLLDFFETIAMLTRKRALNLYMVWHTFDYWIERYYALSLTYIRERQKTEPGVWEDLNWLVPRLQRLHKRKGQQSRQFTQDALNAFIHEEASEA